MQRTTTKMTDQKIREMLLAVIAQVDYDQLKYFVPETSENREDAEEEMRRLIKIVRKYL